MRVGIAIVLSREPYQCVEHVAIFDVTFDLLGLLASAESNSRSTRTIAESRSNRVFGHNCFGMGSDQRIDQWQNGIVVLKLCQNPRRMIDEPIVIVAEVRKN